MIILIPIDKRPSVSHFESVGRFRNPENERIEFCTLRARVDGKYKVILIVRQFCDEDEISRYIVSEILNTHKTDDSVDAFNGARIPNIVKELTDDWTCEYVNMGHCLFNYRVQMGKQYDEGLPAGLQRIIYGHGDIDGLVERLREPYADETPVSVEVYVYGVLAESDLLTSDENPASIEIDNATNAFTKYINSDDWSY